MRGTGFWEVRKMGRVEESKRSRSGDCSYKIRGRDREIAPTVGREGEGAMGNMSRSGDRSYSQLGRKLCIKTEDIANYVKADGQHRVHIILLRLLRLKGNRS